MTEALSVKPDRARQILLVDDDRAFTQFFKEFLLSFRPGAWVVHTADHYAPALACLKEHAVDLVVLDINMPVMDGMQLLTLLRRTHPELQVVILTSSPTPEHRAFCLQNGAALFFDKTEVADGLEKIYAALDSVASAPARGFRGVLRQVELPEVLQLECLARKSSVLEVSTPGGAGRIFISEGAIVHAEFGTLVGEPALFQLLAQSGGEFRLKPFAAPGRQTIDGHWESLLMEGARLSDEASGAIAGKAGPRAAAPGAAPAAARQIQEIVLCSNAAELLYEWQAANVEPRIRLLEQVANAAAALGKSLLLERAGRVEIETPTGRVLMLLQPDCRIFVRSEPA